jgi:ABC-2 type transport system ATP-binding protein
VPLLSPFGINREMKNPVHTGANSDYALEIEQVSHAFGTRRALEAVDLVIKPSRFCVLLGMNGAGKTTLFSLITRLYNNRSGSIRIFGNDLHSAASLALQQLGVVFQQRTLDLDLTVMQNLIYHGALHGLARREVKQLAQTELARAGLESRMHEKARLLSGGQMRRVEISRALMHRPRLLLLDEPTVGLDIEARQGILDHVQELCRNEGLAVLWATHLVDEVLPEAQVVILHKGQVLAEGAHEALLAETGAADIHAAFTQLTRNADQAAEGADAA